MRIQRLNHAVLYVRDARRSAAFYERVLGFSVVILDEGGAYAFMWAGGSDNHHDLALFSVGADAAPPSTPASVGLYHLAWEVATVEELIAARGELEAVGALIGESDHGVNKSLYARDPDGLEFEVMFLVPRGEWGAEEHEAIVRPLDLGRERDRELARHSRGSSG
jgi:catechol-2,3-dioxygenase